MKREYIIFLILIILAAIFSGSTLAISTNYSYLAQQSKNLQAAEANKPAAEAQAASENAAQSSTPQKLASNEPAANSKQNDVVMVVTPEEKQEIQNMLTSLDNNQSSDYVQLVADFQNKHSLNPTGCLDTETLDAIIREVAIAKASKTLRS